MVQEDQDYLLKNQKEKKGDSAKRDTPLLETDWPLAAPLDRIAAAVVDVFVVLSPVIAVAIAPYRRNLMTSVLINDQSHFTNSITNVIMIAFVFTLFYLMLMTWRFGATLGMMFMRIRIANIYSGGRPDLYHSFLRSLVWIVNLLLLGLPHISVFSNRHRRSLHDRISDTVVLCKFTRGVGSPTLMEHSLSRGVFVGILAFILPLLVARMVELRDLAVGEFYAMEQEGEKGPVCMSVEEVLKDWSATNDKDDRRLEAAMALYAAGSIDEGCLSRESDKLFRTRRESPLSYFAKAFIYLDNPEVSNDYLDIVCQRWPSSDACIMTQLVEKWSENDPEGVDELLAQVSDRGHDYVNVWATRQLLSSGRFKLAGDYLDRVRPNKSLSKFIAFSKVKILWGNKDHDQARNVATVSYSSLDHQDRLAIAGWLCHQEMVQGCGLARQGSCELAFKSLRDSKDLSIYYPETMLAMADYKTCHPEISWSYKDIAARIESKALRKYFAAIEYIQNKKSFEKVEILSALIGDLGYDSNLRYDSQRRLILNTEKLEDVEKVVADWHENSGGQEWENLGVALFNRLMQFKDYQNSLIVGEKLLALDHEGEGLRQGVVLASYKLGLIQKSWKLYKKYFKGRSFSQQRRLASASDFHSTVKQLNKRFGSR